jgi:hypothetical protein
MAWVCSRLEGNRLTVSQQRNLVDCHFNLLATVACTLNAGVLVSGSRTSRMFVESPCSET